MMRRGPASVAGGSRERMAAVRRPSRMRTSPARSVTVASGARLGPERSASLSGRNSPTSRETDDAASEMSRSISGFARITQIPLLSPERRMAASTLPASAGQIAVGLNCPLPLPTNAFAAAMSSLRSNGRSAARSNQLFAVCSEEASLPTRPYSNPIRTRIPSPSPAAAQSRNFDRLSVTAGSS